MNEPYPIRPVTEDEFDDFCRPNHHAFNSPEPSPQDRNRSRAALEFERTLAAVDGDAIVGAAGAYSFQFGVPGAVIPAAGVTRVAVLPTHRRRGILRSLMRRQLADIASGGESFAVLWASEAMLYGRYGYGRASWHASWTIGDGEYHLAPQAPRDSSLRLRLAGPQDALPAMTKVFETVLHSRPGLFARDGHWWDRLLDDPESGRGGKTPLHVLLAEDDSGPRGYVVYRGLGAWDEGTFLPEGVLDVSEAMATDPAAEAALWENMLSRDLITKINVRLRPADDPLQFQLLDGRRLRPRSADGLWVRLIDVPGALTSRAYSSAVEMVIEVRDDLLPGNAGRWRLTTSGPLAVPGAGGTGPIAGATGSIAGGPSPIAGGATCTRTSDEPDISLDVRELGAAYLGGTSLGSQAAAGLVTEHRPGAVLALSAAMLWSPSPWCPTIF